MTPLRPDADRIDHILDRADDRESRQSSGARVFTRHILNVNGQSTELPLNLNVVAVAFKSRDSQDAYPSFISPYPGQADGRGDVDIGGKPRQASRAVPENSSRSSRKPASEILCSIR